MSVVKVNAIAVPAGAGAELEERFAQRAREVEGLPGFEGFELLRPVRGDDRYLVYTRWSSEEAFQDWVRSDAFRRGHAQSMGGRSVATHSELLEYQVVLTAAPAAAAAPA